MAVSGRPVINGLLKKNPADRPTAEHTAKQLRSVRPAPTAPSGFVLYQDDRGFAIAMPADWDNDHFRPNSWYGVVVATATLQLDATRGPDRPGTTALAYLADYEKTSPWLTGLPDHRDLTYRRIGLAERPASAGADTVAVLEYTFSYANPNGSTTAKRKLVSAFVTDSGNIYTVELTAAGDPQTIPRTWQDIQPTATTILNSFRIT